MRHGPAARPAPEHDAARAAADRDPPVVCRTEVIEPLTPVRDPHLGRPADLLELVGDRFRHDDVVDDDGEAPREVPPPRGPGAVREDDLFRTNRAVVGPDDGGARSLDVRDAGALEDAHATFEQETAETPGKPRRLDDG